MGLFGNKFGIKKGDAHSFWDWFSREAPVIARELPSNLSQKTIQDLGKALDSCEKGIAWEIGQNKEGVNELIISADGIRENIPRVQRLVQAAPQIPGWRIVAFRQRTSGMSLQFGPHNLDDMTVLFRPDDGLPVHATYYVPGMEAGRDRVMGAVFLLLDCTIGEWDVMTCIGEVRLDHPAAAPPDAVPLSELPALIDSRKANRT